MPYQNLIRYDICKRNGFFKLFRVERWNGNLLAAESAAPSSSFRSASCVACAWERIDAPFAGLASRSRRGQTHRPWSWFTPINDCQTISICFMPRGHLQCQITKSLCTPEMLMLEICSMLWLPLVYFSSLTFIFLFFIILTEYQINFIRLNYFFQQQIFFHKILFYNQLSFNHFQFFCKWNGICDSILFREILSFLRIKIEFLPFKLIDCNANKSGYSSMTVCTRLQRSRTPHITESLM